MLFLRMTKKEYLLELDIIKISDSKILEDNKTFFFWQRSEL